MGKGSNPRRQDNPRIRNISAELFNMGFITIDTRVRIDLSSESTALREISEVMTAQRIKGVRVHGSPR